MGSFYGLGIPTRITANTGRCGGGCWPGLKIYIDGVSGLSVERVDQNKLAWFRFAFRLPSLVPCLGSLLIDNLPTSFLIPLLLVQNLPLKHINLDSSKNLPRNICLQNQESNSASNMTNSSGCLQQPPPSFESTLLVHFWHFLPIKCLICHQFGDQRSGHPLSLSLASALYRRQPCSILVIYFELHLLFFTTRATTSSTR
jgi:hypothetical protein